MKHRIRKGFFLLCIWPHALMAEQLQDVSLRFHAQWDVGEQARQKIQTKYGMTRVRFDQKGIATPSGLSPDQVNRWKRLYELCMKDGCYYCDASEGSCETGTCGPKNANCKPFMDGKRTPQCGEECADFAFNSTQP